MRHANSLIRPSLIFVMTQLVLGCMAASPTGTSSRRTTSSTKGFSSSSGGSTKNAAILMTSYGHTPDYQSFFESDLSNMKEVITDPAGNYQFDTQTLSNATQEQMISAIARSASTVSQDGTLFVYITAHGAVNGTIETAGMNMATFGFNQILQGIHNGRSGQPPFKRLFLVISACYSGSWVPTVHQDAAYNEFVVLTSVDANNLSGIGDATQAMDGAFAQSKASPGMTMRSFLAAVQNQDGLMQIKAVPDSVLDEPLVNSGTPNPNPNNNNNNSSNQGGLFAQVLDGQSVGAVQLQLSVPAGSAMPILCYKGANLNAVTPGCGAGEQMISLVQAPVQSISGRLLFQTAGDLPTLDSSGKNFFNAVLASQGANQNLKFAISAK